MKLKRIFSAAVAAALTLALAVPVFAEGRTETIPGQGEIGFGTEQTISPTFAKVEAVDTRLGGDNTIQTVDMQNKAGATITVSFETSTKTAVTMVEADGSWSVALPAGVTLADGDRIYATQQEAGKTVSLRTVVIVGSGEPGTVIERTIAPTFLRVESTDTKLRGNNTISAYNMRNVPGAAITVTFAEYPGITGTAVVDANGTWSMDVPLGVTLADGDWLYATQLEDGKELSKRTGLQVGSGEDGKVEPDPDPTPTNPEQYLTLSIPTDFAWKVTPENYPAVTSSNYKVTTQGVTIGANKYDPIVEVSLEAFTLEDSVAESIKGDLTLKFTGDFAPVGELQNGVASPVVIGSIRSNISGQYPTAKDTLNFGFTGEYNGGLAATQKTPQYTMVLNFRITNADGWYEI